MTTQGLWSSLIVDLDATSVNPLLTIWLHWSGQSPLTLRLRAEVKIVKIYEPLVHALVAHSLRWRNVTFDMYTNLLDYFRMLSGRLPILRTLDIGPACQSEIQSAFLEIFQDAPQLQDIGVPAELLDAWCLTTRSIHMPSRNIGHLKRKQIFAWSWYPTLSKEMYV